MAQAQKDTANFKDREDAGRKLAQRLREMDIKHPAVFAMPRGGVPLGFQVAQALGAPLDTVVVRKLGVPHNAEFGFGAIAPGDVVIINDSVVESLELSEEAVNSVLAKERAELDRRMVHYKSGSFTQDYACETAVVVDDGLATGVSARAAIESVRLVQKPKKIIFAAPVGSEDAVAAIKPLVDGIVILHVPSYFLTVGQWYGRFNQVSDDEVMYLLHTASGGIKR